MNEADNLELYEKREHELLEELGKLQPNDPNRKPIVQELNTIASIKATYNQNELTRLNNNARNDIEEQKLIIEQEKIRNDKRRTIAMWVQAIFSGGLGLYAVNKSYHMDEHGYPYKDLKQKGLKLIDQIKGR